MSRTRKLKLLRKKAKAPRAEKETKTTIKNKALKGLEYNTDYEANHSSFLRNKIGLLLIGISIITASCVSSKKFATEQENAKRNADSAKECEIKYNTLYSQNKDLSGTIIQLENQVANERSKLNIMEQQLEYFKSTNTNLLERLSDLSVVSKTGAESIKKSLEAINDQNKYIMNLTSAIRQKDSLSLSLVMNLKRSLGDINDEDVNIEVKKGVVYISISDKLLFRSGSYEINQKAEDVLGKIAKVLNDHKQLEILVEGHTDNVPISTTCMVDNWDLSVKRATTVVRYLQAKHNIVPSRMTAGGRSEFVPKTSNETNEGKSINRRTEIIILPQLDQFFELLEPQVN